MFQHCIQLKYHDLNHTKKILFDNVIFLLAYDEINISLENRKLPHCVRSSLETVPAGQEVQEAAPTCDVIEFSGHFVQLVTVLSR